MPRCWRRASARWSAAGRPLPRSGRWRSSGYANSKQARSEDRKRSRAVADAESRVHALEAELAQLEQDLHAATGGQDVAAIERLGQRYVETQSALDKAMENWMALADGQAA